MTKYTLLVSIVPRNHAEHIVSVAKESGIPGATILMGRGTAKSSFLQILGFGDTEKDLIYSLIDTNSKQPIIDSIKTESLKHKSPYGILFSIPVHFSMKAGLTNIYGQESQLKDNSNSTSIDSRQTKESSSLIGEETMQEHKTNAENHKYELITAIINAGYADDVMAAARNAGAGGGTVINARGTGTEEDASFFGISIVPEKEILIILVEQTISSKVISAIKSLPCLSKQGSGIVYSNAVNDFITLGK